METADEATPEAKKPADDRTEPTKPTERTKTIDHETARKISDDDDSPA